MKMLDFVGYLNAKREQARIKDLIEAQAGSMKEVWVNETDDVWNEA